MTLPDRSSLRQQLITARESLSIARRRALTTQIQSHVERLLAQLAPHSLGFCWPYRGEPDLTGLIAGWLGGAPQRRAALPVVLGRNDPLLFREWRPNVPLMKDRYGIPVPRSGDLLVPQVMLVPVNGFDAHGYRIGYGSGHFDRTLAALRPTPTTIGIGFELARLESIDPQPHDLPLDWIVTEMGWVVTPGPI